MSTPTPGATSSWRPTTPTPSTSVTVPRREQERIGAELRTIESRQATLDANLEECREVMDLALRFSTRCTTAYHQAGNRTRRLLNATVLD